MIEPKVVKDVVLDAGEPLSEKRATERFVFAPIESARSGAEKQTGQEVFFTTPSREVVRLGGDLGADVGNYTELS